MCKSCSSSLMAKRDKIELGRIIISQPYEASVQGSMSCNINLFLGIGGDDGLGSIDGSLSREIYYTFYVRTKRGGFQLNQISAIGDSRFNTPEIFEDEEESPYVLIADRDAWLYHDFSRYEFHVPKRSVFNFEREIELVK